MPAKKTKPAPDAAKTKPKAIVQQRVVAEAGAAVAGQRDSGRLLREAAWSRMFGRVESKNPFTR